MRSERPRLSDFRRISTFRLTLWLGALATIGVIALLGLIYTLTARELIDRSDKTLHDQARAWLALPADQLPKQIAADLSARKFDYVALIAPNGARLTGNLMPMADIPLGKPIEIDATATHGPLRLLAVKAAGGETMLIARDVTPVHDLRQRILIIMLVSGFVISVGISLAAVAGSLEPLRRVRMLQQSARSIAAGRLDVRMPIAGRDDELDQFATTVNLMVDRKSVV